MGGGGDSGGGGETTATTATPLMRDVRRYKCRFCDVVRSKKCLLRAHVLEHHKDEVDALGGYWEDGGPSKELSRECQQCGMSFKKPAHLKQHMQSHSLEIWMCEALDPTELQNAGKALNGPVPGWGDPPEKLHQECLRSRYSSGYLLT